MTLLPVTEARARVLAACSPLAAEWVPVGQAFGRVLAGDLIARYDQPPAAVSAMDGYGVRAADLDPPGRWLDVVGESAAGHPFDGEVGPGQVVRLFTGSVVPPGADSVAIQENAERDGGRVRFSRGVRLGESVRARALDIRTGWRGLLEGTVLGPRAAALAVSRGHGFVPVRRTPRIGLLATGDELAWPGETPAPGGIVSSNTTALSAMVRAWGGEPVDLGICPDRREALAERFRGLHGLDLLVTSGGASVGDHDLVQEALGVEGLKLDFWRIAMRPGKPLLFGTLRGVPVLGFPGNPVSASVCAILFLRGALRAMLGLDPALPLRRGRLATPLPANDQREDYMRGSYLPGQADGPPLVEAARRQDSSMFATFATADALLVRAPHAPALEAGAEVGILDLDEVLRSFV